ncbi:PEP-CTERM sorting domain-containing protein [Isosphaeraceae bacterium EP7]
MVSNMRRIAFGFAALALMSGMLTRVDAGMINHSIHSQYFSPNINSLYHDQGTQVVAPTATFQAKQFGSPFLQAVLSDTNLTITSLITGNQTFANSSFNGFSFTDIAGNLGVNTFAIDPSSNIVGFSSSRITLTQGRLLVNLAGLRFTSNGVISLTLTSVPEPTSLALCGIGGMIGIVTLARRKRPVT